MNNRFFKIAAQYIVGFIFLCMMDYLFSRDFKVLKNIILSIVIGSMNVYFIYRKEKKENEN
jgi:hypothetical protein